MAVYAGEIPSEDVINKRWAPAYKFITGDSSIILSAQTSGSFQDFTGQASVTIDVTDSGVLLVYWGFEGHNTATTGSSIRLGVAMTGANSVSASLDINAMASSNGVATSTGSFGTATGHIYTGLTAGSTVVKLQSYLSTTPNTGAGEECVIDNQWLFVSQYY